MSESPARTPADASEAPVETADGVTLFHFVEAVAALRTLRGSAGRSAFTHRLRRDIALAVRHDQRARVYAFNLVQACLDREGGLEELLERLHQMEGDSLAMARVLELAMALRVRRSDEGIADG